MIITDIPSVDLSKYKRLVVFGCSFTNYRWSTWADLLSAEMPQAEYINVGRSGAGNQFIFTQINQYLNLNKLGQDDLVIVLWSSFFREDRYIHGKHENWMTPGNIYTQSEYDDQFVENYVCNRGMAIRDLALIDSTNKIFHNAEFDSISSLSIPPDLQTHYCGGHGEDTEALADVYEAYAHVTDHMVSDLMACFPEGWTMEYSYTDADGNEYGDYHPSVMGYLDYLRTLGFNISPRVLEQAKKEHEFMLSVTSIFQLNYEYSTPVLL